MIGRTSVDYCVIILQKLTILSHSQNRASFLTLEFTVISSCFKELDNGFSVAISTSRGLPDPGIEPASSASPALQAYSLPAEPLGNTYSHLILTEKLWNCLMNTVKSQF